MKDITLDDIKTYIKSIKRPRFKIKIPNVYIGKPRRWLVMLFAFLILIGFIFLLFWLFDGTSIILDDYTRKTYWGTEIKFGWKHKAINTISILGGIAWAILILVEFMALDKDARPFYNLYSDD